MPMCIQIMNEVVRKRVVQLLTFFFSSFIPLKCEKYLFIFNVLYDKFKIIF